MSWVEDGGRIRNTRDYNRRAGGGVAHLLIYPGFKGNPEEDGNHLDKYAHNALRQYLSESELALVIGFSFRDPHLTEIFRQALETNDSLEIFVWCPTWPEGPEVGLPELTASFPGRLKHIKAKFGEPGAEILDLLAHAMPHGGKTADAI